VFLLSELGAKLKEARIAKEYSLDDLQEITKIQKRYLLGIEEGNYGIMPGKFYVRAFIKQYADAVDLNSEQLFEEHKNEIPEAQQIQLPPEQLSRVKTKTTSSEPSSNVMNVLPKVLGVVALVVVVFVIWFFVQKNANNADDTSPKTNDSNVSLVESDKAKSNDKKDVKQESTPKEEVKKEEQVPVKKEQVLKVLGTSGRATTYELSSVDTFKLSISSKGNTWIGVSDENDKSLFQGILTTGMSKSFDLSNNKQAFIVVGNAADTTIKVNDKELEYKLSPTGEVRQDIIIQYKKEQ
jgi:cytoskeletal protein RodZ